MMNMDSTIAIAYRKSITALSAADAIIYGAPVKCEPYIMMPLNVDQRIALDSAKKYALEQSIQNALNKQAFTLQQQAQDVKAIKRAQSLVLLSRIYVGSISFEITEDDLRRVFSPFGPIKSIALSWDPAIQKHKGFSFIEFDLPEAAGLALEQMNGHLLGGRNLRVGRPSNVPQSGSLEAEIRSEDNVKTRVYVASVHQELTDADLQTVFEAFGKVVECSLVPDPKSPGRHRSFGYIEFESESGAIAAVTSMNCFDLAGQLLRVCRALTSKDSPLLAAATAGTVATVASVATTKFGSVTTMAAGILSGNKSASSSAEAVAAAAIAIDHAVSASCNQLPGSPNSSTSGFSQSAAPVANLPPPGVFIPTALGPRTSSAPLAQDPSQADDKGFPSADPLSTNPMETEPPQVTSDSQLSPSTLVGADDAFPYTPANVNPAMSPPSQESFKIPISPDELNAQQQLADHVNDNVLVDELANEDAGSDIAPLSRVLLLENMIGSDEEIDDGLREEVAEECSNYGGDVIRVLIHVATPPPPDTAAHSTNPSGIRVFVYFDHHGAAVTARDSLNGRFFAGRVITATLYDEERFQLHELDDSINAY